MVHLPTSIQAPTWPLSPTVVEAAGSRLRLRSEHRTQLRFLAELSYPFEACGLLVGVAHGRLKAVRQIFQTRNVSEFGTARRRYVMDPLDLLATDRVARRQGQQILGVWHSHPNCSVEPSAVDRQSAWEGYSYVIVSVDALGDTGVGCWRLAGEDWLPEAIETLDR